MVLTCLQGLLQINSQGKSKMSLHIYVGLKKPFTPEIFELFHLAVIQIYLTRIQNDTKSPTERAL